MNKQDELIGILLEKKLINQEKLEEINDAARNGLKKFDDILIEKNIVDAEDLTKLKAKIYNLGYFSLLNQNISDQALNIIPIQVAENYKIICFNAMRDKIKVGITDPDNFKAVEAINFLAKEEKFQVEYYLISNISFDYAFKQYRSLGKEISTALKSKAEEEAKTKTAKKSREVEFEEITKSAPVSKIVSVIIRHAVEGRASDIHIEPMQKDSRVRYRIDGILHTSLILPKNVHSAIVARIKVLSDLKLDETRIPQDGRIRMIINEKAIDLRISILPLMDDEKVVMRILDISRGAPGLEDLGFMGRGLEIIKNNIEKTTGMFLVTGPTGSGKSTTLFSILNKINIEGINIVTLEDPVEYFIEGINQSQIRPEVGFTFASGLRSLLRQDPDVIMVGEIRDNETAELAIHASLTGHFVLSTLHTNDAIGAIPRLLDMKVEAFLLGSTINVIIAQRLGRKICPHCKEENKLPHDMVESVKDDLKAIQPGELKQLLPNLDSNDLKFYKGRGCPRCGGSGYTGRIALVEVLEVTDEIKVLIMEHKMITLDGLTKSQHFLTMKQDGIIKVLLGLTTMAEVFRIIYD